MFSKKLDPFGFSSWIAASQTAAWRLKWVSIPLLILTVWLGRKLYRSIKLNPAKFCGLKHAQRGLFASAFVVFLIALLIGVTVPERLRQRQRAKDAAHHAYFHTFERAVLEYQMRYKTVPGDLNDLRERIPDPYGELAEALKHIYPAGYRPSADFAAVGGQKSTSLRGVAIRKASMSSATDDTPSGGLAFTTYELQLPGDDGILGNDDDWVAENGILKRVSDVSKGGVGRSVSAGILQP